MGRFRETSTYEQRKELCTKIRERYPSRYPIICEPKDTCDLELEKIKFLCPGDFKVAHFQAALRRKIGKLGSEEAIYLHVGNQLVSSAMTVREAYEKYREEDGLLYITFDKEKTFG